MRSICDCTQHPPLTFGQIVPDHHVDQTEFVFECDENHPTGGLWALAADFVAPDVQTVGLCGVVAAFTGLGGIVDRIAPGWLP